MDGQDATSTLVTVKQNLAQIVTNLWNIRGVVGQVETWGGWGIVDQNDRLTQATFAVDDGESSDHNSASDGSDAEDY